MVKLVVSPIGKPPKNRSDLMRGTIDKALEDEAVQIDKLFVGTTAGFSTVKPSFVTSKVKKIADCGNIWLAHEDSLRPGSKFNINTFYKEIAVGVGTGLRLDFDLIVLRLDWAIPLRKPWLPEKQRWIIDEIDLLDSGWRKENLLWNISIGYPF